MKTSLLMAFAAAAPLGLFCTAAVGQQAHAPRQVHKVAFDYYRADEGPAPAASDSMTHAAPQVASTSGGCADGGCDTCDGGDGCDCGMDDCGCCSAEGGFSIMNLLEGTGLGDRLACRNTKLYGNLVQSYTFNSKSPTDRFNGPTTWLDRSNDYQLNQLWLGAERTTEADDCSWDFGYRTDMMYGTNYRWATAAGLEDEWQFNTSRSFYGVATPNAYAEVARGQTKTKIGRFVSPVGFYTVDTTQNFFPLIPYTYQYGEPFTHVGFLSTRTMDDHWTAGAGMTRGWDNYDGSGAGCPGVGAISTLTYTADNKASLAWVGLISNEYSNNPGNLHTPRYFQTWVMTRPMSENLTYVLQSDFGIQNNTFDFAGTRQIGRAMWYGVNQYLYYKVNDCWSWGANFEWFRDQGGFRVGSLLPTLSQPGSSVRGLPASRYGYDGSFYRVTLGPKWTPQTNMFVRSGLAWDFFDGKALNVGGLRPYDDGTRNNQLLLYTDLGITF